MNAIAPETDAVTQAAAGETTVKKPRRQRVSVTPAIKIGGYLQALAALVWLPQAGFLAYAVGQLADGEFSAAIYWCAGWVLVLGIIRAILDAAGARMAYRAARRQLTGLREKGYLALRTRSPLDITRKPSGEAASILTEQAEMVVPYWSKFVPVRIRVMLVPPVILLAVLWFSWASALVLLIAAPLIPVFMALIGMRAQKASEEQLLELGGMNGFLLDRLRGLATIRTFGAIDQTANRLRTNAENLKRKTMAVLRIAFLSSAVLELFSALGIAMVAVYIGFHLLGPLNFGAWGYKLTLGESLFILLLAPAFFEPLRDLSAVWHDRASGEAAIEALDDLGRHTMSIVGADAPALGPALNPASSIEHETTPAITPAIKIDQIYYRHPDGAELFGGFNLEVKPGEHVALLAPSGMGKSTLLALIAGLIAPQSGTITIGGMALDQKHAATLRQRMAWIGQKPHIFAGSPRSNVTLGRQNIDAGQFTAAVHKMALGDVESVLANMAIGESGAGLSGGEALRLALVRAAVNVSADVILADEPTAHLDHETAQRVSQGLLAFSQGKTLIIATHDEQLAARTDRIIRLSMPDRSDSAILRSAAL